MTDQSPQAQLDLIQKAFEHDFERFFPYARDPITLELEQALAEQRAVIELRTRHLGKKSALAAAKKLIGRVAPEERAGFGQKVQATEEKFDLLLHEVEEGLREYIEQARTARESIDVDLGRLRDRAAHAGLGLEGAGGVIAGVILGNDDDEQHVGIAAGTKYVGLPADRKLVFDGLRPDLDAPETNSVRAACRQADAVLSCLPQIGQLIRRSGRLRSRLAPIFVACGDK